MNYQNEMMITYHFLYQQRCSLFIVINLNTNILLIYKEKVGVFFNK